MIWIKNRKIYLPFFFVLFILLIFHTGSFTQNLTDNDIELKDTADDYFDDENYIKAMPLFSQLLSLYPGNPEFNYRFGVCLVETNRNLYKAIDYLQYALAKNIDVKSLFYIGKAYHLIYNFNEAIRYYNSYIEKAKKSDNAKLKVNEYIRMCQNGNELVRYTSDLIVLENKQVKDENFYFSYEIGDFGGKIIVKPIEYKTSSDKKDKEQSLMYISSKIGQNYYSSYGENTKNGKDIYRITRKSDGTWSEPENLGNIINTVNDEDFPYLHPDGKTLYFCSRGHNSMGGYDVFRSVYDQSTSQWSKPENLDFPTNSPYDDILYMSDADENIAYFASNRETGLGSGKISVYKIKVNKNPVERKIENIDELRDRSKLEISLVAVNSGQETEKDQSGKKNPTNQTILKMSENPATYQFPSIELTDQMTVDDVITEAQKDADILDSQSEKLQQEANLAYVTADEKNTSADEKRKKGEDILISLTAIEDEAIRNNEKRKADELIAEADQLEREAISSYNLAKNMDNSAAEIQKEADAADQLVQQMETGKNSRDASDMMKELNEKRIALNVSKEKYITPESELSDMKSAKSKKEQEIQVLTSQKDNITKDQITIEKEMETTRSAMQNETDNALKYEMNRKLNDLQSKYDLNKQKTSEINTQISRLKTERENLKNEISFVENLSDQMNTGQDNTSDLTAKADNINKDQLAKSIDEKEFNKDVQLAEKETNKKATTTDNNKKKAESSSLQNEYNHLYAEAKKSESKVDSLLQLADARKKSLSETTDPNSRTILQREIEKIEQEISEKQNEANSQYSKAHEKELQYLTFVTIETKKDAINEKTYSFSNTDPGITQEEKEYQKEKFSANVYQSVTEQLNKKIQFMEQCLARATDDETKQAIQKEIDILKELADDNQIKAGSSNIKADKLKENSSDKITREDIPPDELLVIATNYKPKKIDVLPAEQVSKINMYEREKKEADELNKKWDPALDNLKTIEEQITSTKDIKEKEKLEKKLEQEIEKTKEDFELVNASYETVNSNQYEFYYTLLEENRIIAGDPDVRLASDLEQESNMYFEKAALIRENTELIEDYVDQADNLLTAKNLEQIAINKQKQAVDLYVYAKERGVKNEITYSMPGKTSSAQNKTTDSVTTGTYDPKEVSRTEITLLKEEEDQLAESKKLEYIAETMQAQSEKNLKEVANRKELANLTDNKGLKNKILKDVDQMEIKGKQDLITAINIHNKADSLKYNVYKNQITQLIESVDEVGNNKMLAKHYMNEADYFYKEAEKMQTGAKTVENIDQKIDNLQKAKEFEKTALNNQDIAVEILMDVEPVSFISNNDLVKMDKLEKLNRSIDVTNAKQIEEDRILSRITLKPADQKDLEKAKEMIKKAETLHADIQVMESQMNDLKEKVRTETNKSNKKKFQKEIENLEKKVFSKTVEAGENFEFADENRYWIYKNALNSIRLTGNSNEARQGKQLEKDADILYRKASGLRDQAFATEDKKLAQKLLKDAYEQETSAIETLFKAYNVYLNIVPIEELTAKDELIANSSITDEKILIKKEADITPLPTNNYDEKTDSVHTITLNKSDLMVQTTNNKSTVENTSNTTVSDDTKNTIANMNSGNSINRTTATTSVNEPTVTTNSQFYFSLNSSILYSNENPIPMNEPLPAGIVFKVQIGAFLSFIPNNTFSGLAPITGERFPGNRFTKYLVGLFRSLEVTQLALEEVRKAGYRDAFIVAYKDGKRISLYMARNELNSTTDETKQAYNLLAQNELSRFNSRPQTTSELKTTTEQPTTKTEDTFSSGDIVKTSKINETQGLLFTIQIGVYKYPVTRRRLYNIEPVYEENMSNGLIRYTTGIYIDYTEAVAQKNIIIRTGISDAFVIAYYKGKKISVAEARELIRTNGNDILSPENKPGDMGNTSPTSVANTPENQIIFKVQLGAYKEQVPTEVVNAFLKVSSGKKLEQIQNEIGYTLYLMGQFTNYQEAVSLKDSLQSEGITDAFVVAFRGDRKIPIEEARSLQNQ